jgi:hypothetical protein
VGPPARDLELGIELAAHDLPAVHGRVFSAREQIALPRDRQRAGRFDLRDHPRRRSNGGERERDSQHAEWQCGSVHCSLPSVPYQRRWGPLVTQIDSEIRATCRTPRELIATLVLDVTGMCLYPPEVDLIALTQLEQPIPELPIRNRLS